MAHGDTLHVNTVNTVNTSPKIPNLHVLLR